VLRKCLKKHAVKNINYFDYWCECGLWPAGARCELQLQEEDNQWAHAAAAEHGDIGGDRGRATLLLQAIWVVAFTCNVENCSSIPALLQRAHIHRSDPSLGRQDMPGSICIDQTRQYAKTCLHCTTINHATNKEIFHFFDHPMFGFDHWTSKRDIFDHLTLKTVHNWSSDGFDV
jgi:hypothetical protein